MRDNKEFARDLIRRAFKLAKRIISLVNRFPNRRVAWIIADQLLRAATSIGANIIEAQAASSKKDFINFLSHALKSGNETKFWLALAKDVASEEREEVLSLIHI